MKNIFMASGEVPRLEDLKDLPAFKSRLLNTVDLSTVFYESPQTFKWLTGIDSVETIKSFGPEIYEISGFPSFALKIVKVVEGPEQCRVAFAKTCQEYDQRWKSRCTWYSFTAKTSDPWYNYTDEGRLVYIPNRRPNYVRVDGHHASFYPWGFKGSKHKMLTSKFFMDTLNIGDVPPEDYINILKEETPGQLAIYQQDIDRVKKLYLRQNFKQVQAKKIAETKADKLQKKISSFDSESFKPFKVNGLEVHKDKFVYAGQELSASLEYLQPKDLIKTRGYDSNTDALTWDRIFETFIMAVGMTAVNIGERYESDEDLSSFSGTIGQVNFTIDINVNQGEHRKAVRYYINKKRINAKELEEVLRQALCFQTQEQFDHFVETVSKCSLEVHRILAAGIRTRVKDNFLSTTYSIKLPVVRKKSRNYIKLGSDEPQYFKIKNTARIISLERSGRGSNYQYSGINRTSEEVFKVLLNEKVVEGIKLENLGFIINEGKKEFENAHKKSKKLLEDTIKILGITEQDDRRGKPGYVIKGKLKTYWMSKSDNEDEHCNNCEVRTLPDYQYVCIIDKNAAMQVGYDKVVNRMYALSNDNLLATQIHTLA